MKLNLKCSVVFEKNFLSTKKVLVNQGSTRSTKTYSILQVLITLATQEQNLIFTIVRKELSTLKATAMRDFFEILEENDLYDASCHNKTENTYLLNENLFEFVGLDKSTKKRGAKRHYLFINEANELILEEWRQLIIRTSRKIWLDYNPSDEESWIYDVVIPRDDAEFIHSTYKDNPFLEKTIVEEIERTKNEDLNFWTIYGLGLVGRKLERIYNNWKVISDEEWQEGVKKCSEKVYGLDFGFNNPTALIEMNEYENDIYLRELIYERGLLNSQLIDKMNELGVDKNKYMNADNAEPDKIMEIGNAGFNIYPADKSVNDGIDCVKRKRLFVHVDSVNLIKELKNYSWKTTKDGKILDEPVKSSDHAVDAVRYGQYRKVTEFNCAFG